MKKLLLFYILLAFTLQTHAQYEGSIEYAITYEAIDESQESLSDVLPAKATLYLKDEKSLFRQSLSGGGMQAFSIDGKDGSSILTMQFMGRGYMVKMSDEQMGTLQEVQKFNISDVEGSKMIAGFDCQKALAQAEGMELDVYYSSEIQSATNFPAFEQLKGIPLEYEMIKGGMKMKFVAISVNPGYIEDSIFEPTEGLISMSFDQFANSFAVKL